MSDQLLQQILEKLNQMDESITKMDSRLSNLEEGQKELSEGQQRIETRLEGFQKEVSRAFSETHEKIDDVKSEIRFLTHKSAEQDIQIHKIKERFFQA